MFDPSEMVVVESFPTRDEAEMARGLLEAEGIPAVVASDDCGSQDPALQFVNGARLLVERRSVDRATQALQAESTGDDEEPV